MGAILHFLLGDRRGGGVAGGLREGFANVRAARTSKAEAEREQGYKMAQIGAQETGAMARTRVTAGARIGSAQIGARATRATAAATEANRTAVALATKNARDLTQANWKAVNNIHLKGEKGNDLYIPRLADEETQDKHLRHLS